MKKGNKVEKNEFLDMPEVAAFVKWLAVDSKLRKFQLNIKNSRYVDTAIVEEVTGIEGLLDKYRWKSVWINPENNNAVESMDWVSTQSSTTQLGDGLRRALDQGDQELALAWSLSILKWGGVSGARMFLNQLTAEGELIEYLQHVTALLSLDGEGRYSELDDNSIKRFDAGLTKIHAFLDSSGSPIYDSRVGAAISMYVAIFSKERNISIEQLRFPAGDARGSQIRNPNGFGFNAAPKFYTTAVSGADWARAQLKLGWILQAVVEQSDIFSEVAVSQVERIHAFQGALFMAGYDLRCFHHANSESAVPRTSRKSNEPQSSQDTQGSIQREPFGKVVPTGITMGKVARLYQKYFHDLNGDVATRAGFVQWQISNNMVGSDGAAASNCAPLMESELGIYTRTAEELEAFFEGGFEALVLLVGSVEPSWGEKEHSYIISAYLAGKTREWYGRVRCQRVNWLVENKFAGTECSANTLVSAGTSFGRYFGLLDRDGAPTDDFNLYFGGDEWEEILDSGLHIDFDESA